LVGKTTLVVRPADHCFFRLFAPFPSIKTTRY
jgi:hypothetical protein